MTDEMEMDPNAYWEMEGIKMSRNKQTMEN
jgi:hypothetical protein